MLSRLESIKDSGNYYYESMCSNILITGHDNDTEIYLRTILTKSCFNINHSKDFLGFASQNKYECNTFDILSRCDICLSRVYTCRVRDFNICKSCSSIKEFSVLKNKQLPFFDTINSINNDQLYQYILIAYNDDSLYFWEECEYYLSERNFHKHYCVITRHQTPYHLFEDFNFDEVNEFLKRYLSNKLATITLINDAVLDVARIIGKFMIDIILDEMTCY
jgi:hypothetical protein